LTQSKEAKGAKLLAISKTKLRLAEEAIGRVHAVGNNLFKRRA